MQLPKYSSLIKSKYIDKINWDILSSNRYVIPVLKKNIDKVNWNALSMNHNAVTIL